MAADTEEEKLSRPRTPTESRLQPDSRSEPKTPDRSPNNHGQLNGKGIESEEEISSEDEDGEDGEDDEPNFKYSRLTGNITGLYRGGDATSTFMLSGDKMIIGTHNGNVNVLSLPSLQALRVYHVHSASITSVSVSPRIPTGPALQQDIVNKLAAVSESSTASSTAGRPANTGAATTSSPRAPRQQQQPVPATPSNSIFIATSSIDGHVSVASLVDPKDVVLRNFARPVNTVALSPDYKYDRSYLSGGLAGNLILTTGGKRGVSSNANTSGTAAAAQGWLGSIGLGSNTGTDKVLHSGEGTISNIKWSLSGKFVIWVNEHGIKIMRSNVKLGSEESEYAWKRIAHVDRPEGHQWNIMAGVWKARCEWVDEDNLASDDDDVKEPEPVRDVKPETILPSSASIISTRPTKRKRTEKVVVGWGDTIWVLEVKSQVPGTTRDGTVKPIGSASILHKLLFNDCNISGLSLYTPSLLLVLAYRTHDDRHHQDAGSTTSTPRKGVSHRQTGLQPELRLINAVTKEEVDVDTLTMSRFESLSAADYHLATMYVPPAAVDAPAERGTFGIMGDVLDASYNATVNATVNATMGATRLFSSAASIRSGVGGPGSDQSSLPPYAPSLARTTTSARRESTAHPEAKTPGVKIYLQSPYDCVLAVKRDLADHLSWLLERDRFEDAWNLVDEHPEIASSTPRAPSIISEQATSTPSQHSETLAEFLTDRRASEAQSTASGTVKGTDHMNASREKIRIGELWLRQLVTAKDWTRAGQVAGKVLGNSARWEHWVLTFAQAGRFDEITPYIPYHHIVPPLPSMVYEVVLGHYTNKSPSRLRELLDIWGTDLFDVRSIISAIENRVSTGDVTETTTQDGEQGQDWRILLDCLARLYLADAKPKEALRCYIKLQNADAALYLIRENRLLPAIADDIPNFLLLRISKDQLEGAPLAELEENSTENIRLLVDEAYQGTVKPRTVVNQLEKKGDSFKPFLFFYLRALWRGQGADAPLAEGIITAARRRKHEQMEAEGHALVDEFADLAIDLFAEYDRTFLMTFLRSSRSYSFEKATAICERRKYYSELVYLLSQTGETKRALNLIINRLGDVSMAIAFAKEQDDPDLWNDLLDYSMDKPRFIRALLEEVGTAINPITLVRRIPEGLEIEGLRDGIQHMVREYEIQMSISEGVARVLRSEVATGMDALRKGRAKAVRFEVVHESKHQKLELFVAPVSTAAKDEVGEKPAIERAAEAEQSGEKGVEAKPGHCAHCSKLFVEQEKDTLIGFACGHVFHLSCLLSQSDDPAAVAAAERLETALAADAAAGEEYQSYRLSVGAKVAHAHIIRNAMREGCTVCGVAQEEQ